MMNMWQGLANGISLLTGILVLLACGVLWMRRHTSLWLLLALIGQIGSMLCRLVFAVSPSTLTSVPLMRRCLAACFVPFRHRPARLRLV